MKKSLLISSITGLSLSLLLANGALADRKYHRSHNQMEYAKVVDARPIYQRISTQVPVESCHYETVAYREPGRNNSYTSTILGGVIGAAVGNELGHHKRNKQVGAVAGGLLGASIGRDLGRSNAGTTRYTEEQVCNTSYRTEYSQQLMGYDVTYKYHGRHYPTRTDRHPGDRIAVDVHVHSAHY